MKAQEQRNECKVSVVFGFSVHNCKFLLQIDDLFIFLLNSLYSVVFFFSMLFCFNYPLFESSLNLMRLLSFF